MSTPDPPPTLDALIALAERASIDTLPPATLEQLAGRLTRLASRLRREIDARQPAPPDPTARLWGGRWE